MNLQTQKRWRTTRQDGFVLIVGKRGEIEQYPDGDLDIWVTDLRTSHRIEKTWKAKNHYDDGALFIRPFSDLDLACQWIKARKKRHLNPKQRLAAIERLKNTRFLKKQTHVNAPPGPDYAN